MDALCFEGLKYCCLVFHIYLTLDKPSGRPTPSFHFLLPKIFYMYRGFSIIRTPIIRIQTLGRWLTSPCFQQQWEKDVAVTGVLLREKAKLLYERLFPNATTPFSSSTGLGSRFTTSELVERSRDCYSTLYYSVAN